MGRVRDIIVGASLPLLCSLAAACGAPATQGSTEPAAVANVSSDTPAAERSTARAAPRSTLGWCQGQVATRAKDVNGRLALRQQGKRATPAGATLKEININGDDHLEIFVRDACRAGKRCSFSVYAACGGDQYALIPAQDLVGDRLDTSMKGILIAGVYWRDILLYEFQTIGDRLGEERTRYRYNGSTYERHTPQGVAANR